jgi:hypothetical protein
MMHKNPSKPTDETRPRHPMVASIVLVIGVLLLVVLLALASNS